MSNFDHAKTLADIQALLANIEAYEERQAAKAAEKEARRLAKVQRRAENRAKRQEEAEKAAAEEAAKLAAEQNPWNSNHWTSK